jgi:hypothetical protein
MRRNYQEWTHALRAGTWRGSFDVPNPRKKL